MMKRLIFLFFAIILLSSCNAVIPVENQNEIEQNEQKGIVPYVSKSKTYYSEYGRKSVVNSYGFCNLDGEVVIEPSNDVSTLECYETNDGFSFYVIGLGQADQSTYANGFDPMKTLIIPANGEWCVELDEVGWWTISAGDGGIFASLDFTTNYDGYVNYIIEAKTLLYDYGGNLVKEFGKSTHVSNYSVEYKNCVEIDLIEEDSQRRIYVNSKGELVENPEYIPYEYKPKNKDFENLPYAENGYDFVDSSDDENFIIYTVGEFDYSIGFEDYTIEGDKRTAYLYDRKDGDILHSFHGNCYAAFLGSGDRFVYMCNYDNIEGGNTYNFALYDTQKKTLVVDNAEDIQHFRMGRDDYFAVSYKNTSILYDSEMNTIIKTYFE